MLEMVQTGNLRSVTPPPVRCVPSPWTTCLLVGLLGVAVLCQPAAAAASASSASSASSARGRAPAARNVASNVERLKSAGIVEQSSGPQLPDAMDRCMDAKNREPECYAIDWWQPVVGLLASPPTQAAIVGPMLLAPPPAPPAPTSPASSSTSSKDATRRASSSKSRPSPPPSSSPIPLLPSVGLVENTLTSHSMDELVADMWTSSAQFFAQCAQADDACLDASTMQISAEHVRTAVKPFARVLEEQRTLVAAVNTTSFSRQLRSARLDLVDEVLYRLVESLPRPDANLASLHRDMQRWFEGTLHFWLDRLNVASEVASEWSEKIVQFHQNRRLLRERIGRARLPVSRAVMAAEVRPLVQRERDLRREVQQMLTRIDRDGGLIAKAVCGSPSDARLLMHLVEQLDERLSVLVEPLVQYASAQLMERLNATDVRTVVNHLAAHGFQSGPSGPEMWSALQRLWSSITREEDMDRTVIVPLKRLQRAYLRLKAESQMSYPPQLDPSPVILTLLRENDYGDWLISLDEHVVEETRAVIVTLRKHFSRNRQCQALAAADVFRALQLPRTTEKVHSMVWGSILIAQLLFALVAGLLTFCCFIRCSLGELRCCWAVRCPARPAAVEHRPLLCSVVLRRLPSRTTQPTHTQRLFTHHTTHHITPKHNTSRHVALWAGDGACERRAEHANPKVRGKG